MKNIEDRYLQKKMIIGILCVAFILGGCKKLIEIDGPTASINAENIYQNDITAASVLTGLYTNLSQMNLSSGGLTSMTYLAGLSSDDLTFYNANSLNQGLNAYYTNSLNSRTSPVFWSNIYNNIYVINEALEGISSSTTLSSAVKQQLLGEARFMRAFSFFYLVTLYGDVPLILSTDYKVNNSMPRSPKELVWSQIILDLKEAQRLLSSEYLDATLLKVTTDKVRPTKWAATALLARVYLFTSEWQHAEEETTSVLNNPSFGLASLDQVFKKNSKESIWQLQPVVRGVNTWEASLFIIRDAIDMNKIPFLSDRLLDSFDPGDQRKVNWVTTLKFNGISHCYAFKYQILPSSDLNAPVEEYSTVFRLAEQYLIRAEARIHLDKIAEGISDLNIVRNRATNKKNGAIKLSPLSTTISQAKALDAVLHERQIELFTEWGHRWLDMKRTGKIDQIMMVVLPEKVAGGVWKTNQQWYPLSSYDLQKNINLVQNFGY